jgi:hypothetical protein
MSYKKAFEIMQYLEERGMGFCFYQGSLVSYEQVHKIVTDNLPL